jgi:hypothetical protein
MAPDLFGKKYRAAAAMLQQLGKMLSKPGVALPPVSLVLVEPVLWSHFEQGPQGVVTRVHVSGPQPGDLVLVSGEVVVGEIVARRLTFDEAHARGLLRLYGSDQQIAQFLKVQQHARGAAVRIANLRANTDEVDQLVETQAAGTPGHTLASRDSNGGKP